MPAQNPYPISGTVTYERPKGATAAAVDGARIWIMDITEGTKKIAFASGEGTLITTTNSSGQYLFDLANFTSSYSADDNVEIWVEAQGYYLKGNHRVDIGTGSGTVNFVLYRRSGLKDGLTRTVSTGDRQYGLEHLGTGMKPGLKDGLVSV